MVVNNQGCFSLGAFLGTIPSRLIGNSSSMEKSWTDRHGQPTPQFNAQRNSRKALDSLIGICRGILADGVVDPEEQAFLHNWLLEHRSFHRDSDVMDLMDLLDELPDRPSVEELEDLKRILECIVEFRRKPPANLVNAINRLLGIVSAIVSDREINDQEIFFLRDWLEEVDAALQFKDVWPGNVISERIERILADGAITIAGRADLLAALDSLVGDGAKHGVPSGLSSILDAHRPDRIEFENAQFCFTGKFLSGTRKDCESAVMARGATTGSKLTKNQKLQYLVIGTLASRDWVHSSYGRKIEKAQELSREGYPVVILEEATWIEFLKAPADATRELALLKSMWKKRARRKTALIVPAVTFAQPAGPGSLNNDYWKYSVGFAARDALGLRYQERVKIKGRGKDKKSYKYMVWTQGPILSFQDGDLFKAKDGHTAVQVQYASRMGWDASKDRMHEGSVTYDFFKISDGEWEKPERRHCTQMQFLETLITGNVLEILSQE